MLSMVPSVASSTHWLMAVRVAGSEKSLDDVSASKASPTASTKDAWNSTS